MQVSLALGMNSGLPLKTTYFYPSGQFTSYTENSTFFNVTSSLGGTTQRLFSNLAGDSATTYGQLIFADKNSTNILSNGSKPKVGKHTVEFDVTINSGSLNSNPYSVESLVLATRDRDDDPSAPNGANVVAVTAGHFEEDVEVFDDGVESGNNYAPSIFLSVRPNTLFDVTISNIKIYHKNY